MAASRSGRDDDGLSDLLGRAEALRGELHEPAHDSLTRSLHGRASAIAAAATTSGGSEGARRHRLDRLLTSRRTGYPLMLLLLAGIFYLTIAGANVPSAMLAKALFWVESWLAGVFAWAHAPAWMTGFFVHGVFRGLAWVVSVMLPPMAIFFPLFTLLEDLGYLPRVAFNLDGLLRRVGAHGKQALTMAMGLGCNAAGVIAARIIESPRERILAIVTNNLVPCNGRWPTLILAASLFLAAGLSPAVGALAAVGAVLGATLVGVGATLALCRILSQTALRGEVSGFQLELPPYRRPRVLSVLYTSLIDRTIFVLGRAVAVAAPAGGLIWVLANVSVGGASLFAHAAGGLDPIGRLVGLDGVILLAFIVAVPANEIVVPTVIMGYLSASKMLEIDNMVQLEALFSGQGWDATTAICLMLFSVLHYPCSTTTWTIWRETRSARWTVAANLVPTALAFACCAVVAGLLRAVLG